MPNSMLPVVSYVSVGPIAFGMIPEEVEALLGSPEKVRTNRSGERDERRRGLTIRYSKSSDRVVEVEMEENFRPIVGGVDIFAASNPLAQLKLKLRDGRTVTLESNAGKAGDAAGRDCYGEAFGYGGLVAGQTALSAVGTFGGNNQIHPFYRFIGPGSRAGLGPGTWWARGTVGSIPYGTVANAASKLQIPTQSAVNTAVRAESVWWRWVAGPRRVSGNPQWGAGGGLEYRVGGF